MKTWVIAVLAILSFSVCSYCVTAVVRYAAKATSLSTPEALNSMPDPRDQSMTLLNVVVAFLTFMLGFLLTLFWAWRVVFS